MRLGEALYRLRRAVKRATSALVYRVLMAGLPAGRAGRPDAEVAVVCFASLGDFIVACEAARKLCERGKRLTLICREGTGMKEFAEMTGYFGRVEVLPHRFLARPANLKRLRGIRVHTVLPIPPERHILSDLYVLAVTADRRILPDTLQGCSLPFLKRLADRHADGLVPVTARSELRRYEQYLQGCGLYEGTLLPFVLHPDAGRKPERCIAVFPGAGGGTAKQWPAERFANVASKLCQAYGGRVIVFGTAAEKSLCMRLCELLTVPAENLCGKTTLNELKHQLARCMLVLANDSGSAHFSIACGVPTVVIGGGWEYGRFYPNDRLPTGCQAVAAPPEALPCIPCGKSSPDCLGAGPAPCLLAVPQETVLAAARIRMGSLPEKSESKEGIERL